MCRALKRDDSDKSLNDWMRYSPRVSILQVNGISVSMTEHLLNLLGLRRSKVAQQQRPQKSISYL